MDNIDCLANELKSFLTFIIEIEAREPKPRPRLPGFFHKKKKEKLEKELPPIPAPSFFPPKTSTYRDVRLPAMSRSLGDYSLSQSEKTSSQLPSSSPYPSNFSPARKSTRVIAWFVAPETIFAFRIAFLTLAFYVFGVSKKTAKIYIENNGIFALLLGQVRCRQIYASNHANLTGLVSLVLCRRLCRRSGLSGFKLYTHSPELTYFPARFSIFLCGFRLHCWVCSVSLLSGPYFPFSYNLLLLFWSSDTDWMAHRSWKRSMESLWLRYPHRKPEKDINSYITTEFPYRRFCRCPPSS
jgi:hypothetical protein